MPAGPPDQFPGIRDGISQSVPSGFAPGFLSDGGPAFPTIGGKLLYVIGLAIDLLLEKTNQGIKARMPTLCDPSALPFIGADRVIPMGPGEPVASYRVRLQRAFQSWQRAGSPRGVMSSVLPMLLPFTPRIRTVSDASIWDTYQIAESTITPADHTVTIPPNWNWDNEGDPHPAKDPKGSLPAWWRWWLIIFSVAPNYAWCSPGPTIGAGQWKIGDGSRSIGFNVPASVINGIRSVVAQQNKGGKWCRYIIVSFSGTIFGVAQAADGVHNPNGTWGPMCAPSGGVYVPTRLSTARYCDGVF